MRRWRVSGPGVGVRLSRELCVFVSLCGAIWLVAAPARGQAPPPTLSSFLGIGADQQSSNPAIQAAAKAKAAKHQICKKKKALQYLAGMGCSPEHPEVGEALLAAMGDPDEPVRYEAVKAVLQTASECQSPEQKKAARKTLGMQESLCAAMKKCEKKFCDCVDRLCGKAPPKEHKSLKDVLKRKDDAACDPNADCPQGNGSGPCCSPDMRAKLMQLAYGRDDKGCFLETSSRVREVAALALQACNACNGCGCDPRNGGSSTVRELPPVEERETAEYSGVFPEGDSQPGTCVVTDRPAPMMDRPAPEPVLAPEPAPLPTAPMPPAPEEIPTPAPDCEPLVLPETEELHSVLRRPPDRLAGLPSERVPVTPLRAGGVSQRLPIGSAPAPVARANPVILSWQTMADALTAFQVSDNWLTPQDGLATDAEFVRMVGEPAAQRLSFDPFFIKRSTQPQPVLTPQPQPVPAPQPQPVLTPQPQPVPTPQPQVVLPPQPQATPGRVLAWGSAGGMAAMIAGGCLLTAILALCFGRAPKGELPPAARPQLPAVPPTPPAPAQASDDSQRPGLYPRTNPTRYKLIRASR